MLPGIPAEAGYYLRMNLNLSPNEMYETSKDLFDTAVMYQNARDSGIAKAREDHHRQQELERKQKESLQKLKERTG